MNLLFRAELLRFRGWALAFLVVHLGLLGFFARMADLAQLDWEQYAMIGTAYVLVGALFGLYQAGSYRRPNHWLKLLHRPLPRWRIAAALFGAGLLLLATAIALPTLLVAAYQHAMTARVVDLRHWLLPLAAWLLAGCGYLAGACAMLGDRRHAWMALPLPVLFLLGDASGAGMLLLQALVLAMLAALVAASFKPDLGEAPRTPAATLATVLPLQFGIFSLLVLLGFGAEMLWVAQGSHPNNTPVPLPGGTREALDASGRDLFLAGLARSRDPRAPTWREQVALSEIFATGRRWTRFPARDALTNMKTIGTGMQFVDADRQVSWTFSHDRMRLRGVGTVDGLAKGELGVGAGNAPFPSLVLQVGDGWMVGEHAAYQYDPDARRVYRRIVLPANEVVAGAPDAAGDALALMTDRALYLFDGRKAAQDFAPLRPIFRVPQPGLAGDLSRVDLLELLDGYLVSFTYEYNAHLRTGGAPFQQVLLVEGDGRVSTVARRALKDDYPPLYRYRTWWLSPVLDDAWRAAARLFAPPNPLGAMATRPVPRGMRLLAGTLMLGSLLFAAARVRRTALSPVARMAWILACGALLRHAADRHGPACERASRAIYEGTLETVAAGVKTPDLGGHVGTTEFTGAVVERIATKLEVWSTLGT